MKLIIINNLYYPNERGGAEKFVRALAQTARTAGHEVVIIATDKQNHEAQVDGNRVVYLASQFFRLGELSKARRYLWQFFSVLGLKRAWAVAQILEKEQPDLVITNNLQGLGLAILTIVAQYKHIHILHDVQLFYPSGLMFYGQEKEVEFWPFKLYRVGVKFFTSKVKLVVSPSAWLLACHQKLGLFTGARAKVLPNPGTANFVLHQAHKPFRLLFVGQLVAHKGLAVLLSALELLPKDFTLTIVGLGQAQKTERINYVGQKTSSEVIELMQQSDCLIMPSLVWENAPLVLTEAQAVGLPAIGSNLGGIAEMINDPSLLFAPGNSKDLADKIKRLASRYDEYAPKQAKACASADYWQAILKLVQK